MILLFAMLAAAAPAPAAPGPAYRLTCGIMGKDLVVSKFRISVAGQRDARRFQLEPLDRAPWAERVTAAVGYDPQVPHEQVFEFQSGQTRYRLYVETYTESAPLTAAVSLQMVKAEGSVENLAAGSCEGRRESGNLTLPSLARLDPIPRPSLPRRYVKITASTQDICWLVTPMGEIVRVDFDSEFGENNTASVRRREGEAWPLASFSVPVSVSAVIVDREADKKDLMMISVGHETAGGIRTDFTYNVGMEGKFVTFSSRPPYALIGSGPCRTREAAE